MDLNPNLIEAKNLLHSSKTWITLAHIAVPNGGGDLRIACNITPEYILWNGYKWTSLAVRVGVIKENKDEVPQMQLRVSNLTRIPESYAESYDGLTDSVVTFYEVNSAYLSETANIPYYSINVSDSSFDQSWATFTLSIDPNPLSYKDPKERIFKNFCRFGYPNSNDKRCPYNGGVYDSCPRTLAACIIRNGNTVAKRYGGYPAIGTNKIYAD